MVAYRCYNDEIIEGNHVILYMFECKKCHERWYSSFCQCPKCEQTKKFKILSGEQTMQTIQDNQSLRDMTVYGLLLELRGRK